jgi:ankyrin repeat protein
MNTGENADPSFTVLLQNGEIERFKQRVLSEPDLFESEDEWGEMPLSLAIGAGNVGLVAFLIGQGVNVNHDLPEGETYLTRAMRAKENSLALARQLLDTGADACPRGPEHRTALHWAACLDAWEVADLLIQRGAHVNATDLDDETPLHSAAFSGHTRMVRLLLGAGADRSIRSAWSGTAEEICRSRGHDDALRVFQEAPE